MTVKETVKALKKYLSDDEHIVVAWWSRDDLGCWDSDGDVDALSEKDWKYCCKKTGTWTIARQAKQSLISLSSG